MSFVYQPTPEQPRLIHHDDQILVVEKPAGLLSVPGRGEDRADCLIARLRVAFPTVLLVHRLDLDTSGVMVFALTPTRRNTWASSSSGGRSRRPMSPGSGGGCSPRPGGWTCR